MNHDIENYNAAQSVEDQKICNVIFDEINKHLLLAKGKIWHGSPVWFIDDNPIVGYSKLKNGIQLLFWSGQTFDEKDLKAVGKYKAAEVRYTDTDEIDQEQLTRWLAKSIEIQWDYKNIMKRKGNLFLINNYDSERHEV